MLLIPTEDNPYQLVEPSLKSNSYLPDSAEYKLARALANLSHKMGKQQVDRVMKLLRNSEFDLQCFQSKFISVTDCVRLVDLEFFSEAEQFGFQCIPIENKETGICYEF